MHVTVALCTHNRCELLAEAIDSFFGIDIDVPGTFDLLVIDNASTDGTRKVVSNLSAGRPEMLSYFFEERIGLANARNAAIRLARGDIVAFTDDDVLFERGWLQGIFDVLMRYPDAVGFAGPVSLKYEAPAPAWIDDDPEWLNMKGFLGQVTFGTVERYLERGETPVGMNVGLRKASLYRIGGYDPKLGRHGTNLMSKEDSELALRFYEAGLRFIYSPNIKMKHRVPRERLTRAWMARRMYWQGISEAVLADVRERPSGSRHLGSAMAALRHLRRATLGSSWNPRELYWRIRSFRFWHLAFAAQTLGEVKQRLKLAFLSKRNRAVGVVPPRTP